MIPALIVLVALWLVLVVWALAVVRAVARRPEYGPPVRTAYRREES